MVAKQFTNSAIAPDGSDYICFTDGVGNLINLTTVPKGSSKQLSMSSRTPDGSTYSTLTDGNGTLK